MQQECETNKAATKQKCILPLSFACCKQMGGVCHILFLFLKLEITHISYLVLFVQPQIFSFTPIWRMKNEMFCQKKKKENYSVMSFDNLG